MLLAEAGRGLDYAFHVTNLRSVWLKVLEPNRNAVRAYTGAGFKAAARLGRVGYWMGAEGDELFMEAVA